MFSVFQFFFGREIWYKGMLGLGESWNLNSTLICIGCVLAIAAVGYICGSVNTAILVTKFIYREDIREKGSGNPGMTNVMRSYGWMPAILTLLGDMLKVVLGMMLGTLLLGLTGAYIGGLFSIIGHIAPVFYKFKGGKGVASMFMFVLYVDSVVFVILCLLFVLLVWATKYLSLGSVMCALVMPLILSKFDVVYGRYMFIRLIIALIIAAMVVFRHRTNITRIMDKTESKFSFKRTKKVSEVRAEREADEIEMHDSELTEEVLKRKAENRKKSAKKKK